jgi:hypothetical protein
MFTNLLPLPVKKSFSLTGVFISIFIIIIAIFIFSNTNVILSKFGFETTTTLKGELVRTQQELARLAELNNSLNKTILENDRIHQEEILTLESMYKEKEVVKKTVSSTIEKRKEKANPIQKKLNDKTVTTDTTITVPIEEYNKLSEQNIDSIHSAFESLGLDKLSS